MRQISWLQDVPESGAPSPFAAGPKGVINVTKDGKLTVFVSYASIKFIVRWQQ